MITTKTPHDCFKIMFGLSVDNDDNSLQVICNNWQAGVLAENMEVPFNEIGNIPTAGVFLEG